MNKIFLKSAILLMVLPIYAYGECPASSRSVYEFKIEQLPETERYLERGGAEDIKFGIESVEVGQHNNVSIFFKGRAYIPEYETNKERRVKLRVVPSAGAGDKIATLVLSPLYIFNPKQFATNMVGCSEEVDSEILRNYTNSKQTGGGSIVENYFPAKTIQLKVEANGRSFYVPIELKDKESIYYLGRFQDLYSDNAFIEFLKENQRFGTVNTSFSCINDCDDAGEGEKFRKSVQVPIDLSAFYKDYLASLQIKKRQAAEVQRQNQLEEEQRVNSRKKLEESKIKAQEEKQKSIDKSNQIKADSAAKALAEEQKSLDQYKEKCSSLGFKSGTDSFGKCVLQLTK